MTQPLIKDQLRAKLEKAGLYEVLVSLHEQEHDDDGCFCTTEISGHYRKILDIFTTHLQSIREAVEAEISKNVPEVQEVFKDETAQLHYKGGYLGATTDMLVVCKTALDKGFKL